MKIGFYGQIKRPFGGAAEVTAPNEGVTVTALRRLLAERYEDEAILERSVRAVVNDEIVPETHVVFPVDTVEFMSPVSGG
ncbi:MAG: MoaD/ThiS family protein [Alphaproteobacteria bacterium]|nr:MoaD/ThiS family protein [Alphaproteobacteria bacterium]